MSEPQNTATSTVASALNHARFDGMAEISECGLQGMITLRGDLSNRVLRAGATKAGGARMPGQGMANITGDSGLAWMSPDEVLVLCPYDQVENRLDALTARLGDMFALVQNVSDARVVFRVAGPSAREVLAKLCPVDLSPEAFKPGQFRRTRMAQVAAAFWIDEDGSIRIIAFRSVAQYLFDLLTSVAQPGSEVGYFTPPD